MSLVKITEKIEQDARTEAEEILNRARELEDQILRGAQEEAMRLQKEAQERFDKERPEVFRRREIVSKLDIEKLHLQAQRQLIREVYDRVLNNLINLDKDAYLQFCERLLAEAFETGQEVMHISINEKYIDRIWLDQFNNEHQTNITLTDQRQNISGGFILDNGQISINCSWDMLLQNTKENMETEVVKRLFPA